MSTDFDKLMKELEEQNPEEVEAARQWAKDSIQKWKDAPSLVVISSFFDDLAKNQEDMPADLQTILNENISDLYEE